MKRKPVKRTHTKKPAVTAFYAWMFKDGPARALVAVAGILAGIVGTHIELGRRMDNLAAQVQGMNARMESIERCVDRHHKAPR